MPIGRIGFRVKPTISGGGTVFTDDFNRADGPLGTGWTHNTWQVISNQAARDNNDDFATFKTDTTSSDMWVEAQVIPNSGFGVINLRHATGTDTGNAYLGFWDPSGLWAIGKVNSGGYSGLASTSAPGGISSVKLRLEAQGTTLRLYADDVLVLTTTDSDHTGHFAGLNAGNGPVFDNFRCGPLPWTP